ncbi:MAG: hypothetical protein DRP18_01625 [Candidatus Aenigmatarchaeota archaeon]|nr:MAG: hypothetical protein DRP18_01625 [Candidatus Aenigmarchaeota archaeon]
MFFLSIYYNIPNFSSTNDMWCGYIIKPSSLELANVSVYVVKNDSLLFNGTPIKYSFDEIKQFVAVSRENSIDTEKIKNACIEEILNHIYCFPGYMYDNISGVINIRRYSQINVYFSGIKIVNLDNPEWICSRFGFCFSESINRNRKNNIVLDKDNYEFHLEYENYTNQCKLKSLRRLTTLIPKNIYNNVLILANTHPLVKDFIGNQKYTSEYIAWFNRNPTAPENEYIPDISSFGHKKYSLQRLMEKLNISPQRGVIVLIKFIKEINNTERKILYVFVDITNGEIVTLGPFIYTKQPCLKGSGRHVGISLD